MRKRIYTLTLTATVIALLSVPASRAQSFSSFILSGRADVLATGDLSFLTPDLDAGRISAGVSYGKWMPATLDYSAIQAGAFFAANENLGFRLDYRKNLFATINLIDFNGNEKGSFRPEEERILAGVSLRFAEKFYVDVNAKYLNTWMPDHKANCFAGDLGVSMAEGGMTIGLKLADLGTKYDLGNGAYSLPMRVLLGGSYAIVPAEKHTLTLGADLGYILPKEYNALMAAAGLQYAFDNMVFARAGYRYGGSGAPSFASFGLGFAFKGVGLDAAYLLGQAGNAWTAGLHVTL